MLSSHSLRRPHLARGGHRYRADEFDRDHVRSCNFGGNRSVGLPLMPHMHRPVGRGITAFGPCQFAESRRDPHPCEAWLEGCDAQHMAAQPGGGATGPAVAEAVAEALVAVVAEVAVDVGFALGHEFVDGRGVLGPGEIEVFPESGRAEVEHPSPVLTNQVERGIGFTRGSQGFKHIQPVEGGNSFGASRQQHVAGGGLGIAHPGKHLQACARL